MVTTDLHNMVTLIKTIVLKSDMLEVFPIPAFVDNYIWCLHNETKAWVVDPGDATPVEQYLQSNNLTLEGVLITHHHADHIGGLKRLVTTYPNVEVYGPISTRIPFLTRQVSEGERVTLASLGCEFEVLEVPAHTKEHIAYFGAVGLFCGDTLFSAGCGRLFEGTPEQMWHNFKRFNQLPGDTKVYCTHEYTQANNQFALTISPEDKHFNQHQEYIAKQRAANLPTLPTSIEQERKVNPFMRVEDALIAKLVSDHTKMSTDTPVEVFAAMRHWKDVF